MQSPNTYSANLIEFGESALVKEEPELENDFWQRDEKMSQNFKVDLERECLKIAIQERPKTRDVFKGFLFDASLVYRIRERLERSPEYEDPEPRINEKKLSRIKQYLKNQFSHYRQKPTNYRSKMSAHPVWRPRDYIR